MFFDGTLWRDDEMIRRGSAQRPAGGWGTSSMRGADGAIAAFAGLGVGRRIFIHINNTNPVLLEDRPSAREAEAAGWEIAEDGMEIGCDRAPCSPRDRARGGAARDRRRALPRPAPFHHLLHDGRLDRGQVQAWALNRYYYQARIPVKDATLIARLPTAELRREWRRRLIDHDGDARGHRRHRALAAAGGRARPRPRLRGLDGRAAAGDAVCRRRLCQFRARPRRCWRRSPRPDRDVLAADHRRAGRRHAAELRLRQPATRWPISRRG